MQTEPKLMQQNINSESVMQVNEWYSEDFIYASLAAFLKENGYKVHKENLGKDVEKSGKVVTATKFFKKEVIEVKGFPNYAGNSTTTVTKTSHIMSWFTEALFNSFVNFSRVDNAEVAIALPNVSRYQAIIEKLYDYFSSNDLYFKIYLINQDGSVDVSNLNLKYSKMAV